MVGVKKGDMNVVDTMIRDLRDGRRDGGGRKGGL